MVGTVSFAAAVALLPACGVSAFTCDDATDCGDRPGGVCQPEGYCSFPDDTCPSGQRFGEYSGSLSNHCVQEGEVDTDASSGTSASPTTDDGATVIVTSDLASTTAADDTAPLMTESSGPPGSSTSSSGGASEDDSSSSGDMLDPDLLLWFTFDELGMGGVSNAGVLGGEAACSDVTCPGNVRGVMQAGGAFDGVDDCAAWDDGDILASDDAFSIATWLYLAQFPNGLVVLFGQPFGDELLNTWDIALTGDGMSARVIFEGILDEAGMGVAAIDAESVVTGSWMHIAVTHSTEEMTLWVNAELASQTDGSFIVSDGQPLLLGCDDDHDGAYSLFLPGVLDDVRLYRRALDADEIFALANP